MDLKYNCFEKCSLFDQKNKKKRKEKEKVLVSPLVTHNYIFRVYRSMKVCDGKLLCFIYEILRNFLRKLA